MGVRGTEMGGPPIAKSVEFSMVPGREGLHLLGQSLRFFFPLFAALFGFLPLIMMSSSDSFSQGELNGLTSGLYNHTSGFDHKCKRHRSGL